MAPARIARARIAILTAGFVGTLASRAPAVEPDQVLELRILTYAAFEMAEVQIAIQTALNPPPAVLSSACNCFR